MVSDIRLERFFRHVSMVGAFAVLGVACTPFGETPADAPPVDNRGSSASTGPSHAPGTAQDAGAEAGPASSPACSGQADCERVVFVTSLTFAPAVLGGIPGADAKCTQLAASSPNPRVRGRVFVAWLSSWSLSPTTRMARGTRAYVRPDGVQIAKDFDALTNDRALDAAIAIDERGATQSGAVWSGTDAEGDPLPDDDCSSWSSAFGTGGQGQITADATMWSTSWSSGTGSGSCAASVARLYCFEN